MAKEKSLFAATLSALFTTLLSSGLILLVLNKLSIWNQLGRGEKFWTIFASAYAAVLTLCGWLYVALEFRVAGIIHAALMLGIAGMVLYGAVSGPLSSPGGDNAVAGVLAAANLVFIVIGALAAICGVAVICCALPGKE